MCALSTIIVDVVEILNYGASMQNEDNQYYL